MTIFSLKRLLSPSSIAPKETMWIKDDKKSRDILLWFKACHYLTSIRCFVHNSISNHKQRTINFLSPWRNIKFHNAFLSSIYMNLKSKLQLVNRLVSLLLKPCIKPKFPSWAINICCGWWYLVRLAVKLKQERSLHSTLVELQ